MFRMPRKLAILAQWREKPNQNLLFTGSSRLGLRPAARDGIGNAGQAVDWSSDRRVGAARGGLGDKR